MNSTKESGLEAAIGPLFDELLLPMAARLRAEGQTGFPRHPDTAWLSYYVRRKRSQMTREDFTSASCLDADELALHLAAHWQALGRHALAAEAPRFAAAALAAQALLADEAPAADVSPYVYAMF